jgi:hypothetical protein
LLGATTLLRPGLSTLEDLVIGYLVTSCLLGSTFGIAGYVIGSIASRKKLIQTRRYSWHKGTVELRFSRPDYAAKFIAAMQQGAASVEQV